MDTLNDKIDQWKAEACAYYQFNGDWRKFFNDYDPVSYQVFSAWLNGYEIVTCVAVRKKEQGYSERFIYDCAGTCEFELNTNRGQQRVELEDTNLRKIMQTIYGEIERKIQDPDRALPFNGHVNYIVINSKGVRRPLTAGDKTNID